MAQRRALKRAAQTMLDTGRLGLAVSVDSAWACVETLATASAGHDAASLWLDELQARDPATHVHSLNVCLMTLAFGRYLGLDRDELEQAALGALLHDIGKLHTPLDILNKPGALSSEEFAVLRRHPEDGYRLLRECRQLPPIALSVVRDHHERVDGSGYPRGLCGSRIHTAVMVTAVADVYEAITSDRCYRSAMTPQQAVRILQAGAKHYGRDLIQEFVHFLGVYPDGSLVELTSGALAVVIRRQRLSTEAPVVLQLREPDGTVCDHRLVDLALLENVPGWQIKRTVEPAEVGIDTVPAAADGAELLMA
ncbi:hypothetical protein CAL65_19945 [Alkalilimnicola ehrlichii]|uniref:HD-GYP domain-containing protein n=1 Tax=Alkalilimnicola ehrlichii TaxID=351052 RepID=A0A3E0WHW0_9GAMM|nr:hypothetical protein CAL65_19945 [Alkalilimnicola ehrlichii]